MSPRNVLITGGSSGIGRAAVERFAHFGDRVWFTYHSGRQRAEAIVAELGGLPEPPVAFEFAQGDWTSHQRLLARLPGPVDVLVNNAAVGSKTVEWYAPGAPHRQDEAFFQVNSVGPLWLARELLPTMIQRGYGKIVNIASVHGGMTQFPAFHIADGMSKAALTYLTRQLAAELAHVPVEIFALCPGAVETSMLEASTLGKLSPDQRRALEARLPKQRLIAPAEIADLVWWLCSPGARALHGAILDASMGLGVHPGLITGPEPDQHAAAA